VSIKRLFIFYCIVLAIVLEAIRKLPIDMSVKSCLNLPVPELTVELLYIIRKVSKLPNSRIEILVKGYADGQMSEWEKPLRPGRYAYQEIPLYPKVKHGAASAFDYIHSTFRVPVPYFYTNRALYKNTMGAPSVNDRGIYDDALFIHSPSAMAAYNGNTDPSRYRKGQGTLDNTKGMACLNPGAWFVHKFAKHKNQYLALCQRLGPVIVTRDGDPPYEDTDLNRPGGYFGINIHRGGYNGTSSAGCQTIHPTQWGSFINLAIDQAKRYHGASWYKACIPYILLDQP
jgi:hypothetical protein